MLRVKPGYGIDTKLVQCIDIKIDESHIRHENTDLLLYVTGGHYPADDFMILGAACDIDRGSFRPNVAQLKFNLDKFHHSAL